MGSKQYMLKSGLGALLIDYSSKSNRFVDLFSGSSQVSWFIAETLSIPVLSVDLQTYSSVLANSILLRTNSLDPQRLIDKWIKFAIKSAKKSKLWQRAATWDSSYSLLEDKVNFSREICAEESVNSLVWTQYGGYYYSPTQSLIIDYLIKYLPKNEPEKSLCLAAIIIAASKSSASPGHTAQPFKPNSTAGKFLLEAWQRDTEKYVTASIIDLSSRFALLLGKGIVKDATLIAQTLREEDLVFIDPPYSGVQYSRFYHVLETIATQKNNSVTGSGRYPPHIERPQSKFSNISQAKIELNCLFESLNKVGSTIVFTFPKNSSSNGLSGDIIKEYSSKYFDIVNEVRISGRFSTLGGSSRGTRSARQDSDELVLVMRPR